MRSVKVVTVIPGQRCTQSSFLKKSHLEKRERERVSRKEMKVKIQLVPDEIDRTQPSVYDPRSPFPLSTTLILYTRREISRSK